MFFFKVESLVVINDYHINIYLFGGTFSLGKNVFLVIKQQQFILFYLETLF